MSNLLPSTIVKRVKEELGNTFIDKNDKLRPMITLSFDDGYKSDIRITAPILQENGMRGSFYIIGDAPHTDMDDAEIKELADNGHEIGCHSWSHPRLTELTEEQILDEWVQTKKRLEGITGKPVYTHAYPYGATNERINHLAGGVFEATRGTYQNIIKDPYNVVVSRREMNVMQYGRRDTYNVPAISTDGLSVQEMKNLIDRFLQLPEPSYMTFYMHKLYEDDEPGKPSDRQTRSQFKEWVEYLGSLKEQGIVDVVPFIEGVRRVTSSGISNHI